MRVVLAMLLSSSVRGNKWDEGEASNHTQKPHHVESMLLNLMKL